MHVYSALQVYIYIANTEMISKNELLIDSSVETWNTLDIYGYMLIVMHI